jgi:type II secretory pathway component PulF
MTIIEPALLIVMGLIIAIVVLALYMPIIEIGSVVS